MMTAVQQNQPDPVAEQLPAPTKLLSLIQEIEQKIALVATAVSTLAEAEGANLNPLIERQMRTSKPPTPSMLVHIQKNAEARDRFIADCGGLLTSTDVANLAASTASNKAQVAYRWRKEGLIFGVEHRGQTYYPALQFDSLSGRPRTIMADLIATLSPIYQGWSLALWFAGANDWLNGERPGDCLDTRPKQVLEAAQAERQLLDD